MLSNDKSYSRRLSSELVLESDEDSLRYNLETLIAKLGRSERNSPLCLLRSSAWDEGKHNSKQSRVIAMLQSPAGATAAAMMKATGWQQHSVRGFLAGVVRKRLKLKLTSTKVGGVRTYRIVSESARKPARKLARPR